MGRIRMPSVADWAKGIIFRDVRLSLFRNGAYG